jgi:hypothetical protein
MSFSALIVRSSHLKRLRVDQLMALGQVRQLMSCAPWLWNLGTGTLHSADDREEWVNLGQMVVAFTDSGRGHTLISVSTCLHIVYSKIKEQSWLRKIGSLGNSLKLFFEYMLWLPLYRSSIRRSPVTHGDYYKRLMQEKLTHALRSIGSPINENTNSLTCKCWNCHHACYCNLRCQHTTTSNVNNPPTPPTTRVARDCGHQASASWLIASKLTMPS